MLLTTTAEEPDAELVSRCIRVSVNEQPDQTAAIHQRQRAAYTLAETSGNSQAVRLRHQHAQRLLEPLSVAIPWADPLSAAVRQYLLKAGIAKQGACHVRYIQAMLGHVSLATTQTLSGALLSGRSGAVVTGPAASCLRIPPAHRVE